MLKCVRFRLFLVQTENHSSGENLGFPEKAGVHDLFEAKLRRAPHHLSLGTPTRGDEPTCPPTPLRPGRKPYLAETVTVLMRFLGRKPREGRMPTAGGR